MEDFSVISSEQVIEQITANPENVELLGKFIDQLQNKLDNGEINSLEFNQTLANTYVIAAEKNPHWRKFAADALYDTATIANQEGNDDLRDELLAKMDQFE